MLNGFQQWHAMYFVFSLWKWNVYIDLNFILNFDIDFLSTFSRFAWMSWSNYVKNSWRWCRRRGSEEFWQVSPCLYYSVVDVVDALCGGGAWDGTAGVLVPSGGVLTLSWCHVGVFVLSWHCLSAVLAPCWYCVVVVG